MRLIDADKFEVFAYDDRGIEFDTPSEAYAQGVEYVLEKIDEATTVDVQEARHGKWKYGESVFPCFCSECGLEADMIYAFCPHCGARMDGDVDEEQRS